jgi:mediator of RNA polymerase II transcription subunit 8, fungi type
VNRTSLQSQANIISNYLTSVSEQLSEHQELLSSIVAYPGPNFPGETQAGVLEQLLRTKLEPRVEDWAARGRAAGSRLGRHTAEDAAAADGVLSEQQLMELWEWAPIEANQEARRRDWGGNFTLEEKESGVRDVVTGLKRQLAREEEEDEEEEEEEGEEDEEEDEGAEEDGREDEHAPQQQDDMMDVVGVRRRPGRAGVEYDVVSARGPSKVVPPAIPIDDVLRFMMTGVMPPQVGDSRS